MRIERADILVLNYNGMNLLAECLPSVVEAAAHSRVPCRVHVVDNSSTDGSTRYLADQWPAIHVHSEPNRGLASFNAVLERLDSDAVLLLNNDVKLTPGSVDPLLSALEAEPEALFSSPQCWTFDGRTYEGMRTLVRLRFGLIQGLCRVPGHERHVNEPGLTASSGPVLAVVRQRFLELGGYDPLYFPGRIEDLDLGFRAWLRGWKGYYVPESVAFHKGFGSFEPAFGRAGCDYLALRNSFLFAWKNLRGGLLASHLAWLPARLLHALALGRVDFVRALADALRRLPGVAQHRRACELSSVAWTARQKSFFRQFRW